MRFMDCNFLLSNSTSQNLFFNYAKDTPIFDYHCHLNPKEIYDNPSFTSITKLWLGADHYKWRAMRSCGIDEKYITGDGDDLGKFLAFAKTLQYAIGNPLYHWAHLELQRFFGVDEPLTEKNAENIYNTVNKKLAQDGFRVQDFIEKSNVAILYTTDDPADTLEWHSALKTQNCLKTKVAPAFRPDALFAIENENFASYIGKLSNASGVCIKDLQSLESALQQRIDIFDSLGCKASDHGLTSLPFAPCKREEIELILKKSLAKQSLSALEIEQYRTYLLCFLAEQYANKGWVMEIHMGVLRNNNHKMFQQLGADSGFDTIGDFNIAEKLVGLLNLFQSKCSLPKIVLFSANPKDNYVIGSLIGCFQSSEIASKFQFGTAWWFNDSIDGMTEQMKALGNLGVLGKFIGMLTDSRSFLSYPRHEYFRRILCNIIGTWIEEGAYSPDLEIAGNIVKDICLRNALAYFSEGNHSEIR